MDAAPLQQALTLITERSTPLICLPASADSDAIAAGLGLLLSLEKLGKKPQIVSPGFTLPAGHDFLPKTEVIASGVAPQRKLVITVDTTQAPLEELSYEIIGNQVQIYLTPKRGQYEPQHVRSAPGGFAIDCVITINVPRLESLGTLYEENRDFFYHTPLINIDHHPSNERFGQVVLVDTTAVSTAEIVFELLQTAKQPLVDETIATALLAGMIAKTQSFRTPSVTPRSLTIASHLIASGARREEIIKNLYQTKSLAVLKLWGRALTRLQSSLNQRFVWTTLSANDLSDTGATLADVPGVIDELIANAAGAQVMLVLAQEGSDVLLYASTSRQVNARELFTPYQPHGSAQYVTARLKQRGLTNAEQDVRATVERALAKTQ